MILLRLAGVFFIHRYPFLCQTEALSEEYYSYESDESDGIYR